MSEYSKIVSDGMKRVCAEFTPQLEQRGFVRNAARSWVRLGSHCAETVHLWRNGGSYGAPSSPSISLRVIVGLILLDERPPRPGVMEYSDQARRHTGYGYHHRFNALTWSTYDRCLEELDLFIEEHAEPWFSWWRDPNCLVDHPSIQPSDRQRIEQSLSGTADATTRADSLKSLGLVGSKLARATAAVKL